MNLIHVYHIYADPEGNWKSIWENHFAALHAVGLWGTFNLTYCGIHYGTDPDQNEAALKVAVSFFDYHGTNRDGYEMGTLRDFQEWILPEIENAYVFYAHTKGASDFTPFRAEWRKCMEHYTIRNWRRCVDALRAGHDTSGCMWLTPERYPNVKTPFYAGNYWWAKAKYLKMLPEVDEKADRFHAESWIGLKNPNQHSLNDNFPSEATFKIRI